MALKADKSLFNRLLKAMAKGEPLPKGTFPEAEKIVWEVESRRLWPLLELAQVSP
jgi:hypothetical protein